MMISLSLLTAIMGTPLLEEPTLMNVWQSCLGKPLAFPEVWAGLCIISIRRIICMEGTRLSEGIYPWPQVWPLGVSIVAKTAAHSVFLAMVQSTRGRFT